MFFSAARIFLLLPLDLAYSELTCVFHLVTTLLLLTLALLVQSGQSFSSSVPTKLCLLCTNKVQIIWWSYLRDFSLEYLLTYKKRIYFFWKSSIADARNRTRRCSMRVHYSDHYTITAWMKMVGSMDHFMPHKLLVLMIFGQRPHHGLWPLTSSLLQNDIGK